MSWQLLQDSLSTQMLGIQNAKFSDQTQKCPEKLKPFKGYSRSTGCNPVSNDVKRQRQYFT